MSALTNRQSAAESTATFPLSSQQREMWLDQALHPDSPLYNIGAHVCIEGGLDGELFERALAHVVQMNDAFRLELVETETLPVQRIVAQRDPALTRLDFSGSEDADARALEWIQARVAEPLPLLSRPLFRFALLKVAPERHYWFFQLHHLMADGWSIALIVQLVAKAYNALRAAEALPQAPEPSYRDIVASQQAYEDSADHARDAAYWREYFSTLPEPLARPAGPSPSTRDLPRRAVLSLSAEFYPRLEAFARRQGTTTAQVMLGVLYGYFTRTAQREDLVLGMATRNRFGESALRTVGLCSNTVSSWYRFGTQLTFAELLRAMREEGRKGSEHRRFQNGEVNRQSGVARTGHSQLAPVSLSHMEIDCDVRLGEASVRVQLVKIGRAHV